MPCSSTLPCISRILTFIISASESIAIIGTIVPGTVMMTAIGTLAGMVAKSNLYKDNTIIIAMANTIDDNIKVSTRVCGKASDDVNLRDMLVRITDGLKVEVGGHKFAAGCLIEGENEKRFIELTLNILKN